MNQIRNQIMNQIMNQIRNQIMNQIINLIRNAIMNQIIIENKHRNRHQIADLFFGCHVPRGSHKDCSFDWNFRKVGLAAKTLRAG